MKRNLPILMYHHVVPTDEVAAHAPFSVSHQLFASQLDWLQQWGFMTISLSELFDSQGSSARRNFRKKPVVITFDDCPASLLDFAIPELKRRGMTATFFAVAGKDGGRNDWDADQGTPQVRLMNADELKKLAEQGFEIGSHSFSHAKLRQCAPDTIDRELQQSRQILEQATGRSVRFLAYPYGEYPPDYAQHARNMGYEGAVSIFSNASTVLADPYCMRRILVHEGDGAARFRFKLSRLYACLRPISDRRVIGNAVSNRQEQPRRPGFPSSACKPDQ